MTPEQSKLLSLFKEINDICNRHNIVYYLAGGTLIGAMRHNGFIPWDDDMDLLMTRDNWLKFLEVTKYDIPENRIVECQEVNRSYPNMFGRYTDIKSSAIHNNQILGDGVAGYVIDILVLDPIPDKNESYQKYVEDLMLYSDLVNPSLNYSYRYRLNVNKDRFKKYYKRMQKEEKEKVLSELEQQMFTYNEDECQYYVMRWGGAPFLFDKDMYGSSRWGDFEGIKCRIPDRTSDYLTWHYGDDWMYIPPHNEQESHNAIFSFTTDYKTIQNDYMKFINVEKVRKSFIKRKLFFLNNMDRRLGIQDQKAEMQAYTIKLNLENKLISTNVDIFKLYKEKKYNELSDLFNEFFTKQLNRSIVGREDYKGIYRFNHPAYSGIDDRVLFVAVMTLIHTNRLAKAERLMNVREICVGELPEDLLMARNLIFSIREAISDYDLLRKEDSYLKTKKLYEKYPENLTIHMLYVRLLIERQDYEEAKVINDIALNKYPNDGVFIKYQGDLEYLHDKFKAYSLYKKAKNSTQNGCTILEIEKIFKRDLVNEGDYNE